jgi:hypothetical protein
VRGGGPVGGEEATESGGIVAGAEIVVAGFRVAFFPPRRTIIYQAEVHNKKKSENGIPRIGLADPNARWRVILQRTAGLPGCFCEYALLIRNLTGCRTRVMGAVTGFID